MPSTSPSINSPAASSSSAPGLVLDTNVVLDWLVFRHPVSQLLHERISGGSVRWIASTAMRAELSHVLSRGVVQAWQPDPLLLWAAWDRWAHPAEVVPLEGAALRLRCSDTDDQKFIDLALGRGAQWLLSRDRAVLKLARRARQLGLAVLTPEAWAAEPFSAG